MIATAVPKEETKHPAMLYQFGIFLKNYRIRKSIPQPLLCQGLCTSAQLSRIESGDRIPKKLLLEALLGRLGISSEDFEHFLDHDEYAAWQERQQIQRAILERRTSDAGQAVTDYRHSHTHGSDGLPCLDRQFCDGMEAQTAQMEGRPDACIGALYRQALEITVSDGWQRPLKGLLLSPQEVNLMLESARYGDAEKRTARYQEILDWLDDACWEPLLSVKLYPKTVYYLYQEIRRELSEEGKPENPMGSENLRESESLRLPEGNSAPSLPPETAKKLFKCCSKAIRLLRDCQRSFYLWELTALRLDCIRSLEAALPSFGGDWKRDTLRRLTQETKEWRSMMEDLCGRFHMPLPMEEACYLYTEKNVYMIEEVIHLRRTMLGLSMEKLADGICSPRAIQRLERGTRTQRYILDRLMLRLGLPAEYCRFEVVTGDPEAHILLSKLRNSANEKNTDQLGEVLNQLQNRISMDIPVNKQLFCRGIALLHLYQQKISPEEYADQIWRVMGETIPREAIRPGCRLYLTNGEVQCLQNSVMLNRSQTLTAQRCIDVLYQYGHSYEERNVIESYINIYETIMDVVGSRLGDWKEYEQSNYVLKTLIKENLMSHRLCLLPGSVYGLLWNWEQEIEDSLVVMEHHDARADLQLCMMLCKFTRKIKRAQNFYKRLLKRGYIDCQIL